MGRIADLSCNHVPRYRRCCRAVALVLAQKRPNPPSTFEVHYSIDIRMSQNGHGGAILGDGKQLYDYSNQKVLQDVRFDSVNFSSWDLQRFDLGVNYTVIDNGACEASTISGQIPDPWAWLENATYIGEVYEPGPHMSYDFWSANLPEGLLFVGFFTTDPNTPGFVQLNATNGELVQLQIHVWLPQPIAQSRFNVPEACQKAEVTDAPVSSFPRRFFGL